MDDGSGDPAKPRLDLLRSLTDEHVLRALMRERRLTRAELAVGTGISKPAVSNSVRRLTDTGFLADTGERTAGGRGRGRVGSYYALADGIGTALAVSIAPDGIVAELLDSHGDTLTRAGQAIRSPARPAQVTAAVSTASAKVVEGMGPLPRLAVASAADPVDRATGRLIGLPDAPFLLGDLDAAAVLAPFTSGPVTVDNDVNWAARAERDHAHFPLDDFAYLYLGDGLGAAVVTDGDVRRGHGGLAGEIAHVLTAGPDGQAMTFTEVFAELGLRRPGSAAIDSGRLLAAVTEQDAVRRILGRAISGVLAALVAVTDPAVVVTGGPWGSHPDVGELIAAAAGQLPRSVPVRTAEVQAEPSLAGVRADALIRLRSAIIDAARTAASAGRPSTRPPGSGPHGA
jgi:predicted NBD/HSP70 family sugar kinase